jgi:hypothetical protein
MKSQRDSTENTNTAQQHECTQIGMKLERTNQEYQKDGKAISGPTRISSIQLASKNVEIAWYELNIGISFVIGVEG